MCLLSVSPLVHGAEAEASLPFGRARADTEADAEKGHAQLCALGPFHPRGCVGDAFGENEA